MFTGALGCRVRDFSRTLKPGKVAGILVLMYGVTPLAGWVLARVFLGAEPELMAGQIFAAVLPAGITASVWTIMAGGDLPLALSLVVLATLLSGLLTPGLFRPLPGGDWTFTRGVWRRTWAKWSSCRSWPESPSASGGFHRTLNECARPQPSWSRAA